MRYPKLLIALPLAALTFTGACSDDQPKVDARDIQEEAKDVWASIRDYSIERREDFQSGVRSLADDLGDEIGRLDERIDAALDEAGDATRGEYEELKRGLAEARQDLDQKLEELRLATKENWSQAKAAVASAYEGLKQRVDEAASKLH